MIAGDLYPEMLKQKYKYYQNRVTSCYYYLPEEFYEKKNVSDKNNKVQMKYSYSLPR